MNWPSNFEANISINSGIRKTVAVRYPTDEEWAAHIRRIKQKRRQLGRGKSQAVQQDHAAANAELFELIALDKEHGLDEAEIALVLGKLDRSTVKDVSREAQNFQFELDCGFAGITTKHVLRMPTAREMRDFDRKQAAPVTSGRFVEVLIAPEPIAELYDLLHVSHSGYDGPVPLTHKLAVVFELQGELNADEDDEPELLIRPAGPSATA